MKLTYKMKHQTHNHQNTWISVAMEPLLDNYQAKIETGVWNEKVCGSRSFQICSQLINERKIPQNLQDENHHNSSSLLYPK